jgi:tellurite methyltransferase
MKDYYEEIYRENEHYWGHLPSPVALLVLGQCRNGRVLDIGAGQGPDALFFAKKGCPVTAIDISPKAIADLKQHAQELRLAEEIDAKVADMRELPRGSFDIVFSRMALQMIEPAKRREYIRQLKAAYPDALHAHVVPVSGACFGSEFIFDDKMLKDAYSDWQIIFYEEAWTISRVLNKNGEPFLMREARIIARRPAPDARQTAERAE